MTPQQHAQNLGTRLQTLIDKSLRGEITISSDQQVLLIIARLVVGSLKRGDLSLTDQAIHVLSKFPEV